MPGEVPALKIVDFGASKKVQVGNSAPAGTYDSKPNSLVGTYYYVRETHAAKQRHLAARHSAFTARAPLGC